MSPTSYQAAPPPITFEAKKVPHVRPPVKCHRHHRPLVRRGLVDSANTSRAPITEVRRPTAASPTASLLAMSVDRSPRSATRWLLWNWLLRSSSSFQVDDLPNL